MDFLRAKNPRASQLLAAILPIGLWAALWLSIAAGTPRDILSPHNLFGILQGLRSIFPFIAASLAALVVALNFYRSPQTTPFLGPLGLTAVYGLVGIVASLRSPDTPSAIYWAAVYLSVPLVLWAVACGSDPLGQIHRIVNFTWLIFIFAVSVLFAIGVIYLDLIDVILNPAGFFRCENIGHWFTQTSGLLRSTGVGRYAAVGAIVSFTGLWSGKFRVLWALTLLACLMLLTTSGARTAMLGLAAAGITVTLLYTGKKGAIIWFLAFAIFIPIHMISNVDQPFLDGCFLHKSIVSVQAPIVAKIAQPLKVQSAPSNSSPSTNASPIYQAPQAQVETTVAATERSLVTGASPISQAPLAQAEATVAATERSLVTGASPISQAPLAQAEATVAAPERQLPNQQFISNFSNLSGRTLVWADGRTLIKQSPLLGYGFNADRLILGKHMHNAYLHAMLQTGILGTLFFLAALIWGLWLLLRALLNLDRLPGIHRHSVVQMAGLMAFLAVRSLPESSGAFFGIDWFLLALLLIYLQAVNRVLPKSVNSS